MQNGMKQVNFNSTGSDEAFGFAMVHGDKSVVSDVIFSELVVSATCDDVIAVAAKGLSVHEFDNDLCGRSPGKRSWIAQGSLRRRYQW